MFILCGVVLQLIGSNLVFAFKLTVSVSLTVSISLSVSLSHPLSQPCSGSRSLSPSLANRSLPSSLSSSLASRSLTSSLYLPSLVGSLYLKEWVLEGSVRICFSDGESWDEGKVRGKFPHGVGTRNPTRCAPTPLPTQSNTTLIS